MSITAIKLIALVTMIIDHIGYVFGSLEGWRIIPTDYATLFRVIGRIAFPLFSFSIVNGWKYTKNKSKYLTNLSICAILSQIPYTLVFHPAAYGVQTGDAFSINIYADLALFLVIAIVILLFCIRFKICKTLVQLIQIMLSFVFAMILIKIDYNWILADQLNVIYTFLIGLMYIYCFEKMKTRDCMWYDYTLMILSLILITLFIGLRCDYGNYGMGLILVLAIYLSNNNKNVQLIVVILWGLLFYGLILNKIIYILPVVISAFVILKYNNNKPVSFKKLFYISYPLHLFVLGIINLIIKQSTK